MATSPNFFLKQYPIALLGLWFTGAIVLILRSIFLCDGHLIYTLDDPYIHLRVAQIILRGGYGINIGEYSSPCSSIIYPYLLTITELAGFGILGPLVLNILAMALAVYAVSHIIQDYVFTYNIQDRNLAGSILFPLCLGLLVCIAMNSWGLVMTGMEHSLHVLAVVLVIWGFLRILDAGSTFPAWLIAAIVVLPFIRFEGLAMSLFSVTALIYLGHRGSAFVAASLIVLGLFCWFLFTRSLGLPVLPGSVLLKSAIAANATEHGGLAQLSRAIFSNFRVSISNGLGVLLLLTLVVVFILSYKAWQNERNQIAIVVGGLTILTGLAHIFGGTTGLMFPRYVIYVNTLVMISSLVLGRFWLVQANVKHSVFFVSFLVAASYITTTFITPKAAQNIYQQQYQMHRFVVEYWKQPVAVNDLGWVSYNNPSFVLDLVGLGSEEVRRLRMTESRYDAETLFSLVERRHVSLIMIYDDWFKLRIPIGWQKVAILNTSKVSAWSDKVSFYITPTTNHAKVLELLHQFGKTLPKGSVLNYT